MSRPYAKTFYASKAWRACRAAYFASKFGICESCGAPGEEVHHIKPITPLNINDPEITLNHDNLMLLCKNCHFQIHEKNKHKHRRTRECDIRCMFDENGNVIPKGQVIVVWGAPCSGKSTYVNEHMRHMDIKVDLDEMFECFTGITAKNTDNSLTGDYLGFMLPARESIFKLIENKTGGFATAWIITAEPNKEKREELIKRFNAKDIHIDTDITETLKRMSEDENRQDKERQKKLIVKYFENLQL